MIVNGHSGKNLNVFFFIFDQKHRSKTPSGNLTFTIIVYEGAQTFSLQMKIKRERTFAC
jgi:hypothetical protein